MDLRQTVSIRQIQTLSPQFILSQQLLQMPVAELVQEIEKELSENPALEIVDIVTCPHCGRPVKGDRCENCGRKDNLEDELTEQFIQQKIMNYDSDQAPYEGPVGERENSRDTYMQFATREGSFHEHLLNNYLASEYPDGARDLGEFLINLIDEDGFLSYDAENVADMFDADVEGVERVVGVIQTLDPVGVGARDGREALLIQIRTLAGEGKENELAEEIIENHFEDLGKNRHGRIAAELDVSATDVDDALTFIRSNLNPYPGRAYLSAIPEPVQIAKPAIEIKFDGKALSYEVLELADFRLRINNGYLDMYRKYQNGVRGIPAREIKHIREYFRRAKFYQDSIEQRKETLDKIARALCEEQVDFLIKGLPHFNVEITQGKLASKVELHESTISRAMSGKFVRIPSGELFSFDFFFDSSVRPKEYIRNLVYNEDNGKPISDSKMREILLGKGIKLARRTVAKYREELGIPSSFNRRKR